MSDGAKPPSEYPWVYYAILYDDDTINDPSGVYRRRGDTTDADAFGREGRWIPTEYFLKLHFRGTEEKYAKQISSEYAARIIHRWRAEGAVPIVEGVDLPPLNEDGGDS